MTVACEICGRSGEPPAEEPAWTLGPWALLRITELRKAGDSDNPPAVEMIVCSKSCAILAILLRTEIRDVRREGQAA